MLLEIKTRNTGGSNNIDYQGKSQSRSTSNQFAHSYCNVDIEAVNINSLSNKNIKLLVQSNSSDIKHMVFDRSKSVVHSAYNDRSDVIVTLQPASTINV
jgi:hypothetical protein